MSVCMPACHTHPSNKLNELDEDVERHIFRLHSPLSSGEQDLHNHTEATGEE